jgi:hypothetical protein
MLLQDKRCVCGWNGRLLRDHVHGSRLHGVTGHPDDRLGRGFANPNKYIPKVPCPVPALSPRRLPSSLSWPTLLDAVHSYRPGK